MSTIVDFANNILWNYFLIYLLIGTGIYFSIRTRCIQVRRFFHSFSLLLLSRQKPRNYKGITSFQALCTSLAARVGTGNLAGVAIAITLGGPGAVFWMWVVAIVGMSTAFVEATLAQVFKVRNEDGSFRGGPAYYIERGLGQRWLGIVFAIFLIIAFGFVFNAVQSNSVSVALNATFKLPVSVVGVGLLIGAALIIFGGVRSIGRFAEIAVPFMAIAYVVVALLVVLINFADLPRVFMIIIKSAFGWHEAISGGIAYTLGQAVENGVKRGLFSNEAGMGSAPNAAAAAKVTPKHPASQGFIQMLGVFFDTLIICTATGAIIILSDITAATDFDGIQLTQIALSSEVGSWGAHFVAIILLFFAFTSIVANYYYGEINLRYIKNNDQLIFIYRVAVLVTIMLGAVGSSAFIWSIADLSMGLMATINLIAILLLSKLAFQVMEDYEQQINKGETPTFDKTKFQALHKSLPKDVW